MSDKIDFPIVEQMEGEDSSACYCELEKWEDVYSYLDINLRDEIKTDVILKLKRRKQANYIMELYTEFFYDVLIGFPEHIFIYKEKFASNDASQTQVRHVSYRKIIDWSKDSGMPLKVSDLFCSKKPCIENISRYYRFICFDECFEKNKEEKTKL